MSYATTEVAGSTIASSDGAINADNVTISADATNSADTKSYAVAAGVVGIGLNTALSKVDQQVEAHLGASSHTTTVSDVDVLATAQNTLHAQGFGVTIGVGAIGGMVVRTNLGRGGGIEEVVSAVDDNAVVSARFLTVNARSTDQAFSQGEAAGGGVLSVLGADVETKSDQSTLVHVGKGAQIDAQAVTL